MENVFVVIIAVIAFLILLVSLFFLFKKKKENSIEEIRIVKENNNEEKEVVLVDEELIIKNLDQKRSDVELVSDDKEIVINKDVVSKKISKTKSESKTEAKQKSTKLAINISSKTEQNLLDKLNEFESTKGFLKKEVNLNYLAKQFNTNTKYLSEIIKSYKNKNFNQYLNELRIDYLIEQLKTDDKVLNTKLSYLASDFGFNSHSSFSTIFTQYVGKTPSEYIKELKEIKN
jgi:AraC-like DNA-binding protein